MFDDTTGIILAGGKSSRMGMEKPLLTLGARTAIERAHALMASIFSRVVIVAAEADRYRFPRTPCIADEFPGAGPVAGIHAGLNRSETEWNFIIACDMPLMTVEMVSYIAGHRTQQPVTVARSGGSVHYLCGLYNRSCLPIAETLLRRHALSSAEQHAQEAGERAHAPAQKASECSAGALCELAGMSVIDAEALPFYAPDLFFNMNRPEDLAYIRARLDAPLLIH